MTSTLLGLHRVSRHFVRRLDLVARAARTLGANLREVAAGHRSACHLNDVA